MDKDWKRFLEWCESSAPAEEVEIPAYDFMGMIGTTGLTFLFYYYYNEKPYTFRNNLGYHDRIFFGNGKDGLAQVHRQFPNYYTVPEKLQFDSIVFTITEHEFQTTIIYNEIFHKNGTLSKVRTSDSCNWHRYSKEEVRDLW